MPVAQYLLARIVNQLVIVVIQVILAIIIGAIAFQVHPEGSGWYLDVAFILVGALVFITIGQLIAALSPRLETATIISQIHQPAAGLHRATSTCPSPSCQMSCRRLAGCCLAS